MDQTDPSPEWTSARAETRLDESMWQLGLDGGESYPERPDEPDCIYYLRTGFCGYGARCRFNHPRDRAVFMGGGEYPERVGQPVCQYYMRTGTCKFGVSCKYHHPRQGGGFVSPVLLNYYGYPLRPGEKECTYYIKTGQCKFGATCKFHHPQPTPAPQVAPVPVPVPAPTLYPTMQSSSQQYGVVVARPPLVPGSYVQGPYGPLLLSPGIVPFPGWSSYPASISPVASPSTQSNAGPGAPYGITQLSPSAPAYTGPYQPSSYVEPLSSSQKEHQFPERPGQPECQYYLRTGVCKFGSTCRYHHPAEWSAPRIGVVLSPIGLPLRQGAPPCTHFAQHGVCKFGPACKFDHAMGTLSNSPSASSLADMPVAHYPESSIGTLAPSPSSSELHPDVISGSNQDPVMITVSSSINTSSACASVGYSKSESTTLSSV